jgi:uncharacterized membrane protein YccC
MCISSSNARPEHAKTPLLLTGVIIATVMVDGSSDSFLIGGYLTSLCGHLKEKRRLFPNLRNPLQNPARINPLDLPRHPPNLQQQLLQHRNHRLLRQTLQNQRRQPNPQPLQRDQAVRHQELKNHLRAENSII